MRRIAAVSVWFVLLGLAGSALAADPLAAALKAAVTKHTDHARDWLEGKDYKSLAKSAAGLELLGNLLSAQSDDEAWQAATARIEAASGNLATAARAGDDARCRSALKSLDEAAAAIQSLVPTGKRLAVVRRPNLRQLMQTLESVQADAKIALLTGNTAAAKNGAYVLSELGRVVSNSRSGEGWSAMSEDLIDASLAAARSPATDMQAVRQLFRNISQSCEDCHENR